MGTFKESDHPRDDEGKFTDGNGHSWRQNTGYAEILADDIDTIPLPDEQLGRSLGAKWANYDIRMPDGTIAHFVEGSKLHHKEVFAGKGTKTPIRDVERLVTTYGGKAEEWQKIKGIGTIVLDNGEQEEVEIHWYEEPSVGRREIKYKTGRNI